MPSLPSVSVTKGNSMANELEDDLLDGDDGDDLNDDGAPEGDPSKTGKTQKSPDKRISDLQSKADKQEARANKAESALKRLQEAMKEPDAEEGKPPAGNPVADAATLAILDMAKMFAVQQHPRLAEFGLSAADLTGSTPSEVAQSAAALVTRFEKIETQVKNKVLAENGFAPEIDAGAPAPTKAKDFSKMSSEDFKKTLEAALAAR